MFKSSQHALPEGTHIESYEVKGVLGSAGFGITYIAYDHSLMRDVALKEYLPDGLAQRNANSNKLSPVSAAASEDFDDGLERFLHEARTLARFNDPNIVRVTRYLSANGTAYLVMDYEKGESLASYLKRSANLPTEESVMALLVRLKFLINYRRLIPSIHIKRPR